MELENKRIIHSSEKSEIVLGESNGKQYIKKTGSFSREAVEKIAEINSPYIAWIVEIGEDHIITEYADGGDLSKIKIPPKQVFEIALELCDALCSLHEKNIVHRDIKPSNIILSNDGHIKLIDFDAARIQKAVSNKDTRFVGTDGFAPPEQYGFSQTDERTDIYSFGVTIKLLLGKDYGSSPYKRVIEKCMRFDPNQRYGSIKAVKAALKRSRYAPVITAVSGICAAVCAAFIAVLSVNNTPKIPVVSNSFNSSDTVYSDAPESFSSTSSNSLSSTSSSTAGLSSTASSSSDTANTSSLAESVYSSSTASSSDPPNESNDPIPPVEDEFDPSGYTFRWELLTMPNDFPVFMESVSDFKSLCLEEYECINYAFYWNYLPETEAQNFVQVFKDTFGGEEELETNWISKIWHVYGDVAARVIYITGEGALEPPNSCYLTISDYRNGTALPKLNCNFEGDSAVPEFSERTLAWADSPMNGVIPELSEKVGNALRQGNTFNFGWDYMMIGEVGEILEKINDWLGDCGCTMATDYYSIHWMFQDSTNEDVLYVIVSCDQMLRYPDLTCLYVEVKLKNKNSEDE